MCHFVVQINKNPFPSVTLNGSVQAANWKEIDVLLGMRSMTSAQSDNSSVLSESLIPLGFGPLTKPQSDSIHVILAFLCAESSTSWQLQKHLFS